MWCGAPAAIGEVVFFAFFLASFKAQIIIQIGPSGAKTRMAQVCLPRSHVVETGYSVTRTHRAAAAT